MRGSNKAIKPSVNVFTSSSYVSATLYNMVSNSPVSSPTSTMFTTIASQTFVARNGSAIDSPSRIASWTLVNARPMRYTVPSFNAKAGTDVAIEELVLSVEDMQIV